LPGERAGPDRGARDPVGRAARDREVRGRDGARAGGVLQGAERPPRAAGGDAAEAEHGDARVGGEARGGGGDRRAHGEGAVADGSAGGSGDSVPVGGSERGGGDGEPERDERAEG